jgi:hypothetical protein
MVRFVLTRIAQARRWAAEAKYCEAALTRALEAHRNLLPVICALTDAEADAVEPEFTELEVFLFSLGANATSSAIQQTPYG